MNVEWNEGNDCEKRGAFTHRKYAYALVAFATPSGASEQTKEALAQILMFANEMCNGVPLHGSQQRWQLSGEAQAKLRGVIKAAADAGFSGAAKYNSEEYSGLLQKDLLAAQQNRSACRKAIFDSLNDKLLRTDSSNAKSPVTTYGRTAPYVSLTFDDFTFDQKAKTLLVRGVFNNTRPDTVTVTAISFWLRMKSMKVSC